VEECFDTLPHLKEKPVACEDPEVLAAGVWELDDRLDGTMDGWRCTDSTNTERAIQAARAQLLEVLKRTPAGQREEQIDERTIDSKAEFDKFNRMMAEREKKLGKGRKHRRGRHRKSRSTAPTGQWNPISDCLIGLLKRFGFREGSNSF
jgi:hypothetical protein